MNTEDNREGSGTTGRRISKNRFIGLDYNCVLKGRFFENLDIRWERKFFCFLNR